MTFLQDSPSFRCNHPNGYGDAKDSIEARNANARREFFALFHVIRKAKRASKSIRIANYRIGQAVDGEIINKVLKYFSLLIRSYRRRSKNHVHWRYYTEATGKDRVHFHGVFISDWSADGELKVMWHTAVKEVLGDKWQRRRACMKIDPSQRGLVASARYVTGCTAKKMANRQLFKYDLPFMLSGGSQGFYGRARKDLIKQLARYARALQIAEQDQFVLTRTIDEYLAEAEQSYRMERLGSTFAVPDDL